jgi:anti-sigma factor RsiW
VIKLLRRRDGLVCQQVVELVTEYLEGALPRSDRKRFEYHLRHCPNCTNYLEQMRLTIRATGTLRAEDLPPQALEELTELFHRWRSDESDDRSNESDDAEGGEGESG